MIVVGIDENGLGPLLGPLVVTAVAFEAKEYHRERFWQVANQILVADDSKKVFKTTKLASAEKATRDWLTTFGVSGQTYLELSEEIVAQHPFQVPCIAEMPAHCLPVPMALPLWSDRETTSGAESLYKLKEHGISPVLIRAFSICPGTFNAVTAPMEMNKFQLDCQLMLALLKIIVRKLGSPVHALCGKVGSTKRYGEWIENVGLARPSTLEESAAISTYDIDSLGRVSFVRDADSLHLPVAVASMVGKYLRELSMRQLNETLHRPGLRRASGYRDKVTAEFVRATADTRAKLGMPEDCFTRNS
jgi:ribonuclease HII